MGASFLPNPNAATVFVERTVRVVLGATTTRVPAREVIANIFEATCGDACGVTQTYPIVESVRVRGNLPRRRSAAVKEIKRDVTPRCDWPVRGRSRQNVVSFGGLRLYVSGYQRTHSDPLGPLHGERVFLKKPSSQNLGWVTRTWRARPCLEIAALRHVTKHGVHPASPWWWREPELFQVRQDRALVKGLRRAEG